MEPLQHDLSMIAFPVMEEERQGSTVYKTVLTPFVKMDQFWQYIGPTPRNLVRVALAAGLSTLGGGMAGDPRVSAALHVSPRVMVWVGSTLGGIANGFSTYLAWETPTADEVAALQRLYATIVNKQNTTELNYQILLGKYQELAARVVRLENQMLATRLSADDSPV